MASEYGHNSPSNSAKEPMDTCLTTIHRERERPKHFEEHWTQRLWEIDNKVLAQV